MPPESNAAFDLDMSEIIDDTTGHTDDEISGLDFGNDVSPDDGVAVEETPVSEEAPVVEETPVVEEAVVEEVVGDDVPPVVEEAVVEEEDTAPKQHMIPKRRLDDVVAKQRKAEQELADIRKELAEAKATASAKPAVDIHALSKQHGEALLDGDLDKAADINDEIIAAISQNPVAPPPMDIDSIYAEVEAKLEFKAAIATVFGAHPELDHDSDQFDEDLNAEAMVFQQAYLNQGHSPAEAVHRASKAAITMLRPELLATKEAPAKPAAVPRATNVKGNVAASNAQPPKMDQGESGGTTSSQMVDITKLTDEEFDALPEATRARMRGDLV
jgi:hypothetical protein